MEGGRVVMEIDPFHLRVIEAGRDVCEELDLLLAGGYAMKAHGLVDRPSKDLDFATANPRPLEELAATVAEAYRRKGFTVNSFEGNESYERLLVTDPESGEWCELDLMKAVLQVTPVRMEPCTVVGFDDAIGLKMGALFGRGVARDLIDIASLAGEYSFERLEWLGRSHHDDFSLERLVSRLERYELQDDSAFVIYGLDHEDILRIKKFALEWAQDINLRLLEEAPYEDPPYDDAEIDAL
jgi:predicted nucleotidyltransferase component of viral defense system